MIRGIIDWGVGQILGMDLIDVRREEDKVTYVYRTVGILRLSSIQKMKAAILSLISAPSDLPIEVRVFPEKRGIIWKGYIIEVDVHRRPFKVRGG